VGGSVVGALVGAGVVGPIFPPPQAQQAILAVSPAWAYEFPYEAQFVPTAYHRQLYVVPSLSYHPPLSVHPGYVTGGLSAVLPHSEILELKKS
jgi:hypothetical protein